MSKSPEQELFDAVYSAIQDKGYTVYDYLPQENEQVEYPFVVVGGITTAMTANKSAYRGKATITIDVWGDMNNKVEVSTIGDDIFTSLARGINTELCSFEPRYSENSKQLMQDTSVETQIFNRCMVQLTYSY